MSHPEWYSNDADRTVPDSADAGFGGPDVDEPLIRAAGPELVPDEADPADVLEQRQEVPTDDDEELS
jgi:hypothetical protein